MKHFLKETDFTREQAAQVFALARRYKRERGQHEKALAGLGRDLYVTGRLSPDGVTTALAAMRRFRAVLEGWNSADAIVVATAAVRDALDGQAFVDQVLRQTGLHVRVLSGGEEARYAAGGVLAGSIVLRRSSHVLGILNSVDTYVSNY